jgi:hypothetical protein
MNSPSQGDGRFFEWLMSAIDGFDEPSAELSQKAKFCGLQDITCQTAMPSATQLNAS